MYLKSTSDCANCSAKSYIILSPIQHVTTSNFPEHVFYPSVTSPVLLSFCFLIWMSEPGWGDALSKLIYIVVHPDSLALQLKLSLHAHCSEFRKTPSVLLFRHSQDTDFLCCCGSFPYTSSSPTITDYCAAEVFGSLTEKDRAVFTNVQRWAGGRINTCQPFLFS